MQTHIQNHSLMTRAQNMEREAEELNYIPTQQFIDQYETLDRDITRAMINADKLCQTHTPNKTWSPKLKSAAQEIKMWRNERNLRRKTQHIFRNETYPWTTSHIETKYKEAKNNFEILKDLSLIHI